MTCRKHIEMKTARKGKQPGRESALPKLLPYRENSLRYCTIIFVVYFPSAVKAVTKYMPWGTSSVTSVGLLVSTCISFTTSPITFVITTSEFCREDARMLRENLPLPGLGVTCMPLPDAISLTL